MTLNLLLGTGSAASVKYFDIRLDRDHIVFRGRAEEASNAYLSGTVVLCLSEPLPIKSLRLHFTGTSQVCCYLNPTYNEFGSSPKRNRLFYKKTWDFKDTGNTELIQPGNYEFPFHLILPSTLPESVDGPAESWVKYQFKAEIGRRLLRDIVVSKPLRIIRSPGACTSDLGPTRTDGGRFMAE
ncbi:hypothetical protein EYZ11_009670 [Aspergillus tanneri]|uniref:Arrestin-like N-terminal domain-containing protein n=1 Tax=Aspergillus tanneri TaxID=1220188 RepID=A0A4S3J7S5_9EURO|nr:hypothetical protein EYZ11_009670 [Aspergillus tanneri]